MMEILSSIGRLIITFIFILTVLWGAWKLLSFNDNEPRS